MRMPDAPATIEGLDRGTLAFCVAFMVLGAAMIWGTQSMTPLGAVFPRTIGFAMTVIALVLFVVTLVRRQRSGPPAPGSTPRRLGLVMVMALWVAVLPVLGFFATSGLAFAALMLLASYEGWTLRRALVYAGSGVALLAGFYVLFVELLHVPAPRGVLF